MQPLAVPEFSSALLMEYEAHLPACARQFLDRLVHLGLIDRATARPSSPHASTASREYVTDDKLGHALVHDGSSPPYQLDRILAGTRTAWCWATTACWRSWARAAWASSTWPSTA